MKPLLLCLLLSLAAFADAPRAHIGITEAEARQRYGEPVKQGPSPGAEKGMTFEKDGIYIVTLFRGGKVGQVIYTRKDRQPFTPVEVEALLQKNGARWQGGPRSGVFRYWASVDGALLAMQDNGPVPTVMITTKEFQEASRRASAAAIRGL